MKPKASYQQLAAGKKCFDHEWWKKIAEGYARSQQPAANSQQLELII